VVRIESSLITKLRAEQHEISEPTGCFTHVDPFEMQNLWLKNGDILDLVELANFLIFQFHSILNILETSFKFDPT